MNENNMQIEAEYLKDMGLVLHSQGQLGEALEYYTRAITIDELIGDMKSKATHI